MIPPLRFTVAAAIIAIVAVIVVATIPYASFRLARHAVPNATGRPPLPLQLAGTQGGSDDLLSPRGGPYMPPPLAAPGNDPIVPQHSQFAPGAAKPVKLAVATNDMAPAKKAPSIPTTAAPAPPNADLPSIEAFAKAAATQKANATTPVAAIKEPAPTAAQPTRMVKTASTAPVALPISVHELGPKDAMAPRASTHETTVTRAFAPPDMPAPQMAAIAVEPIAADPLPDPAGAKDKIAATTADKRADDTAPAAKPAAATPEPQKTAAADPVVPSAAATDDPAAKKAQPQRRARTAQRQTRRRPAAPELTLPFPLSLLFPADKKAR